MTFADRLEELRKAATPGTWRMFGDRSVRLPGGLFSEGPEQTAGKFICRPDEWGDAEIIAFLANNADAILELVRAAEAYLLADISTNDLGIAEKRLTAALAKLNGEQT